MSELSELIKIAKNLEKQNEEIIRLLKKVAGEDEENDKFLKYKSLMDYTPDFGELYIDNDDYSKEETGVEDENTFQIGTLLENEIGVGEVYFIENMDIFKLSVTDNETSVDNLTGDGQAEEFGLYELIASQSVKNNESLDDSSVILSPGHSQNLPETMKICVEQGAEKVYLPLFASAQLIGAPQVLMNILKLDFYKSEEHLLEKLFN